MPNRIVRDSLLDSERYTELIHPAERLLFLELLLLADDFGLVPLGHVFLRRRTTAIAGMTAEQSARVISALADADLVRIYHDDNQRRFGYIPRFGNYPRALKPKWPMPPDAIGGSDIKALMAKRQPARPQSEAPPISRDAHAAQAHSTPPPTSRDAQTANADGYKSTINENNDLAEICTADAVHLRPKPKPKPSLTTTESIPLPLVPNEQKLSTDPPPAKPATPRRSTRCPLPFPITDDMRRWAAKSVPSVDIERETPAMLDHEFAHPKSDWLATWRNWMRRAAKEKPAPRLRVAAQSAEPAWVREKRERTRELLGPYADTIMAKPSGNVIDMELAGNVTTLRMG